MTEQRMPSLCQTCRGQGTVQQKIGRLPGATARRSCPKCGGRGLERL